VTTITEYGRIMIPASEVERILASAERYNGLKKKPARSKAELEAMRPELQTAWQSFVQQKRVAGKTREEPGAKVSLPRSAVSHPDERKAALKRLSKR
jgi:hypothetical protein